MFKKTLALSILLTLLSTGLFAAESAEPAAPQAQPSAPAAAAQSAEPEVKVKIGGNIELSASYENYRNSNSTSKFNALANFGLDLKFTDWISGKIAIEIETAENYSNAADILDEAYLKIGNTDKFPLFLMMGKIKLPFQGEIESIMFTDSMTLELGKVKVPALQLAAKISFIEFGVGVFKAIKKVNRKYAANHIHDGYLYLKIEPAAIEGMAFNFSLLSNVLDGKFLSGGYEEFINGGSPELTHRIPGFSAAFNIPIWKIKITAEMIAALRKVDWRGFKKPYSWFFEVSIKPLNWFEAGLRYENAYAMEIRNKMGAIVRFIWGSFSTAIEFMYLQKDNADKTKGFSLASVTKLEF